ncbi:MAG: hypothetical protein WC862_01615 [Patescibacteria group bacterium]
MPKKSTTGCARCKKVSPKFYYEPTGTCIYSYPEENLLHVHFGNPTWKKEMSADEADWAHGVIVRDIYPRYPDKIFFTIMDLSKKEGNEYVSREAMEIYKDIGSHSQSGPVAQYGKLKSMKEVSKIIMRIARIKKHLYFVDTLEEAEKKYQKWYEKPH